MNRNVSRRYETQDTKLGAPVTAGPGLAKRRALVDITNSVTTEEVKDITKKQVTAAPLSLPAMVMAMPEDIENEVMPPSSRGSPLDRVYMQRPSDDIDARDTGNPVLVTCYVNDLYINFNETEREFRVNSNYMSNQPYVNERMRTILADWLVEVHLKFKMVPETLYMTSMIIDRYLEVKQVRRSKLQLVGVSALLVSYSH